jgi:hypothetical protein
VTGIETVGTVLVYLLAVWGAIGVLVAIGDLLAPPNPVISRAEYDKLHAQYARLYAAYHQAQARTQATEAITAELFRTSARLADAVREIEE